MKFGSLLLISLSHLVLFDQPSSAMQSKEVDMSSYKSLLRMTDCECENTCKVSHGFFRDDIDDTYKLAGAADFTYFRNCKCVISPELANLMRRRFGAWMRFEFGCVNSLGYLKSARDSLRNRAEKKGIEPVEFLTYYQLQEMVAKAELKRQLSDTKRDEAPKRQKSQELEDIDQQLKESTREADDLRNKLTAATKKIGKLSTSLTESKDEAEGIERQLSEASAEAAELKKQLKEEKNNEDKIQTSFLSRIANLLTGHKQSTNEAKLLKRQLSQKKDEVEGLKKQLLESRDEVIAINSQLSPWQQSGEDFERQLEESRVLTAGLNAQLMEAKTESADLQGQLVEAQNSNAGLVHQLAKKKEEITNLRSELTTAINKAAREEGALKGARAKARGSKETKANETAALREKLKESKGEVKTLKDTFLQKKDEFKELEQKLSESKERAGELSMELSKSRTDADELERQLNESRKTSNDLVKQLDAVKKRVCTKCAGKGCMGGCGGVLISRRSSPVYSYRPWGPQKYFMVMQKYTRDGKEVNSQRKEVQITKKEHDDLADAMNKPLVRVKYLWPD